MEKEYCAAKEMAELFCFAMNIPKYSPEEQDAIFGSIPMTEEIFKKCLERANSLCDYENTEYLKRKYPQFLKR